MFLRPVTGILELQFRVPLEILSAARNMRFGMGKSMYLSVLADSLRYRR